jgi:RNA polymerase sigma factor (sigma-70 family)
MQQWNRTGPFINYIAVVASNLIRDRLARMAPIPVHRGQSGRADDEEEESEIERLPDPNSPDEDELVRRLDVQRLAECVKSAINRLSETYRHIIQLRYGRDLTHEQIAQKLGKTTGYVGPTLRRAEKYLREEVRETCGDHLGDFDPIF